MSSCYRIGDLTGLRSWLADQMAKPAPATINTIAATPVGVLKNDFESPLEAGAGCAWANARGAGTRFVRIALQVYAHLGNFAVLDGVGDRQVGRRPEAMQQPLFIPQGVWRFRILFGNLGKRG